MGQYPSVPLTIHYTVPLLYCWLHFIQNNYSQKVNMLYQVLDILSDKNAVLNNISGIRTDTDSSQLNNNMMKLRFLDITNQSVKRLMNTKQTFITSGMIKSRQKIATKASKYYIYVIHPNLIHIFITKKRNILQNKLTSYMCTPLLHVCQHYAPHLWKFNVFYKKNMFSSLDKLKHLDT